MIIEFKSPQRIRDFLEQKKGWFEMKGSGLDPMYLVTKEFGEKLSRMREEMGSVKMRDVGKRGKDFFCNDERSCSYFVQEQENARGVRCLLEGAG